LNFESIRRIHLIGVCGTAMAPLAGLLKQKGYDVSGSDEHMYPPMSTQLDRIGIRLYSGYAPGNLHDAKPDLVIPGNAIPRGNPELEEMLNMRFWYTSMTEAIKELFLREKQSIVVAGTHGKTTTSCLASWLLHNAGMNPSFLLGGLPRNFDRSYQWNPDGECFVIEGDEYDTGFMDRRPKFVNYLPEYVLLNPVEYDHADVYPDLASIENAFWQMIKIIPSNGTIIVNRDSETAFRLAKKGYSRIASYGFHPESDYRLSVERWEDGTAHFHFMDESFRLKTFGKHNLSNAAAVAILGKVLGLSSDKIQRGFDSFEGVRRRMELRGEVSGISVYDDFAHHPTAIRSTLEGVRTNFPKSRIWGVFEPRSWSSRRNVFQKEFGESFRAADLALIAPVFEPEKLPENVRLNPEQLVEDIRKNGTSAEYFDTNERLLQYILNNAQEGDQLILMSNGSFDGIHENILNGLKSRGVSSAARE
jgi:UDP-N-acetylmuramate: L-alanyl-gamma-D-glutamyl-meso-diaminopimelate ligase